MRSHSNANQTMGSAAWIEGLITTIIPVYNRPHLLQEAVQSVLQQQYPHTEIIIIDDGSTDDTPERATALMAAHPSRIRLLQQPNSGPGRARQHGIDHARGEFIQFLDSDDLLLPEKFLRQVAALRQNPEAEIAYGKSYEENHMLGAPRCSGPMRATGIPLRHLFPRLLNERWWTTSCPLYRKRLLDRIGPIQDWINEEDWEYDARAGAERAPLVFVDAAVSLRRILTSTEHLSAHGSSDPRKLRDRALAQQSIHRCALRAGTTSDCPEMQTFCRSAFLLSRQCAQAGLEQEAADLQNLARLASGSNGVALDLRLYGWAGRRIGWRRATRLMESLRQLRTLLGPERNG
ncbi:MAG: glycosyltransferase family 2 protein [Synechococcaceae cyanobacterium]|jgi:glycosyltransferase involved in cell wall biosynthesis